MRKSRLRDHGISAEAGFHFGKLDRNDFADAFFLHGNAEERVRLIHRRLSVRDDDELRLLGEFL